MIELKNLSLTYPKGRKTSEVNALQDISMKFDDDSFNVLVGSSGAGKSSILHCVAGLVKYDGDIFFDGVNAKEIPVSERNMSLVSQKYILYPHMTIFDNIAFPLKAKGASKKEIVELVNEIAKELGIEFLLTRKPKELSGGQQQKVALARAMVKRPKIYLFDEPLSNVSEETRVEHRMLIKKSVKKYNSLALYVTHNLKEALVMADKIYVIEEGELIISGTPEEIMKSSSEIVVELLKASDVL